MTGCKMKNTSCTSLTPLDSRISVLAAFELVAGFSHTGCVRQSLQPYGCLELCSHTSNLILYIRVLPCLHGVMIVMSL